MAKLRKATDVTIADAPPFEPLDEAKWEKYKAEAARHPYNNAVVEFAERWGSLMQQRLLDGFDIVYATLIDGWPLSRIAATENISGHQYHCAKAVLRQHWKHGIYVPHIN